MFYSFPDRCHSFLGSIFSLKFDSSKRNKKKGMKEKWGERKRTKGGEREGRQAAAKRIPLVKLNALNYISF